MPAAVKPGGGVPGVGTAGYPASIGDRFLARLIDGCVIIFGMFVFAGVSNLLDDSAPTLAVVPSLIAFAIYFGYEFVAIGLFGQTLGKRVMKLHVVAVNGGPAGWGASAGRVYIPMLAGFVTCGLGGMLFYLSPLFDGGPWKRGWMTSSPRRSSSARSSCGPADRGDSGCVSADPAGQGRRSWAPPVRAGANGRAPDGRASIQIWRSCQVSGGARRVVATEPSGP